MAQAVKEGNLAEVQQLHAAGCPWDENTCTIAACYGQLELLQWMRANDCPWDEHTCWSAARNGYLDMLQWARVNGCPWSKARCMTTHRMDVRAWVESGAGDYGTTTKSAAPRRAAPNLYQ